MQYDSRVTDLEPAYPARAFEREDPSSDDQFYSWPRKVVHIDDGAIEALTDVYQEILPRSGVILDLMSAWRSHLPQTLLEPGALEVVGLGMNHEEMRDNPQLHRSLVHDLNQNPILPFEDNSLNAVTCAVSVQYLTRPVEVFQEVARVLRPGAPFIVSFSNRCFPTKAVAIWTRANDEQHVALVRDYFNRSGEWSGIQAKAFQPAWSDPLFVVWGASPASH